MLQSNLTIAPYERVQMEVYPIGTGTDCRLKLTGMADQNGRRVVHLAVCPVGRYNWKIVSLTATPVRRGRCVTVDQLERAVNNLTLKAVAAATRAAVALKMRAHGTTATSDADAAACCGSDPNVSLIGDFEAIIDYIPDEGMHISILVS